jgi:hypothetical protein
VLLCTVARAAAGNRHWCRFYRRLGAAALYISVKFFIIYMREKKIIIKIMAVRHGLRRKFQII